MLILNETSRFVESEKWRAKFGDVGVDVLVSSFDYPERPLIFAYYPQYYHKTDKVKYNTRSMFTSLPIDRPIGRPPDLH